MPRAFVVDDDPAIREPLCAAVRRLLPGWEIKSHPSGEALLADRDAPDLLLLDVSMGETDGIETARRLRERGSSAVIVFITGVKEAVFDAFDVGAFHYLLKPVGEEKLKEVLDRASREILHKKEGEKRRLLIRTRDRTVSVGADEIYYLENEMRKLAVHTKNETLSFYGAMSKAEEQLGDGFFRCHRGYLVNLAHIAEYDSAQIVLENGERIMMSKEKYRDFVQRYLRFLRGKERAYD
ncbi:MAG: LytTR family DNA-binding domain-containing protein [Bacteroides sp.]|nr:LytTR family DNA-binding domain-containing protein [Eubacterium sp.]MCM1419028.1 LytTR family DNA-binding domain-containing protein [Roseburia sp.]MCM1462850.1 LytTR family DNA-binding domain-containing protein [Bacteroides sp.]